MSGYGYTAENMASALPTSESRPDRAERPTDWTAREAEKIGGLVAGARRLVADGKQIDLSALQDRVRDFCQVIDHGRETATSPDLPDALLDLISQLDQLAADLSAQNRRVLEGEGVLLQASRAYAGARVASARHGDGDNN